MNAIRASEAPIVAECGLAAQPPEREIDDSGPDAALGRAVHDSLDAWIAGGREGEPQPQPHANRHQADPAVVADLAQRAPAALREIKADLAELRSEVTIESPLVRGRIDALALTPAQDGIFSAAILDWKTGRDPTGGSKRLQRLAYASAVRAVHGMPASGVIYTAEVWLATGEILESRFGRDAIDGFDQLLEDRLARPVARPGPHCRYCRRRFECSERETYIRSGATALAEVPADLRPAEQLALLWDQSRALTAALNAYNQAVDLVLQQEGSLDLPDGRQVVAAEVTRHKIDARKAWPVLDRLGLGPDEINATLLVNKTKLLNEVARLATRGNKAAAKAEAMDALDQAGAVSRETTRRKKVI